MSAERQPTVADVIGAELAARGVARCFGVMGSGNLVATNALAAGGVPVAIARHEGGAVAMADGFGRVSGELAAASVHQGPGLTNTLTALAEAAKARTPLLVLAGDTPAGARRSNFRIDQHGLVASVGALNDRVHDAGSARADVARAVRRARLERRPLVLHCAIDLQARAAADEPEPVAVPLPRAPSPAGEDVAALAALLSGAERPVLVGGRGAVLAEAGPAIEALGDAVGALLATSAMANGLFAGSPWALGIAGGFSSPLATKLLGAADVVVGFGAALNHWTTRHGALLHPGVRLVQVDVEADALGAHRPLALGVVGDARATALAVRAALDATRAAPPRGARSPELAREIATRRWNDERHEDRAPTGRVDPRPLTRRLDALLPADRTVVVDSGHLTGWPAMHLSVADPRSWVFCNAFQAVGLGLGAAIGAAVARPEHVTVAAVGDGGLFLALPELETAARLGVRLLVLVYDDAAYGAEVHHFGPGGHDVDLARFPDVDLAVLARGAGMGAATIRQADELDAAVGAWLATGADAGPLLLDAKVDPTLVADWLADAFRAG